MDVMRGTITTSSRIESKKRNCFEIEPRFVRREPLFANWDTANPLNSGDAQTRVALPERSVL
jgi:hypothetical protein